MVRNISLEDGFWPILALDHGLTGSREAIPAANIPDLLVRCKGHIGSVVMTYGMARFIKPDNSIPLIIQCFGAPLNLPKTLICSIESAIGLGAAGVAIQIDFRLDKDGLTSQIRSASQLASQAHREKVPVLFMVAQNSNDTYQSFSENIRFCQELGADLIKIRLNDILSYRHEDQRELGILLNNSPPALLSGGSLSNNILEEVAVAKEIGFSGYCIGRNIFQSDNPPEMSRLLHQVWSETALNGKRS